MVAQDKIYAGLELRAGPVAGQWCRFAPWDCAPWTNGAQWLNQAQNLGKWSKTGSKSPKKMQKLQINFLGVIWQVRIFTSEHN